MPFKRTTSRTFRADVKVPVANDKGGYDENTFVAIFSHASSTELEELRKVMDNRELIKRKLVGWEMKDADTNEDVPFTPEHLAAVLEIPPTPMQISVAFWEQVNGARSKNF